MRRFSSAEEMIRMSSVVDASTGCWNWQPSPAAKYGDIAMSYWGKFYKCSRAHQLSVLVFKGSYNRKKVVVSHLCHNTRCVNPEHLTTETQKANLHRNVDNPSATNSFILESTQQNIRDMLHTYDYTISRIAKVCDISTQRVRRFITHTCGLDPSLWEGNKFTQQRVCDILKMRSDGFTLLHIATKYNADVSTVSKMCKGSRRQIVVNTNKAK